MAAIAGWVANSVGLSLSVIWKSRAWPASLAGPAEISVAQPVTTDPGSVVKARSGADSSGPLVNDGTSLTGVTVIVNVWIALSSSPPLPVPPSSVSLTLTVEVPLASAAGV